MKINIAIREYAEKRNDNIHNASTNECIHSFLWRNNPQNVCDKKTGYLTGILYHFYEGVINYNVFYFIVK